MVKIATKVHHCPITPQWKVLWISSHTSINSTLSKIEISDAPQCAPFSTFCTETIHSREYFRIFHNISAHKYISRMSCPNPSFPGTEFCQHCTVGIELYI